MIFFGLAIAQIFACLYSIYRMYRSNYKKHQWLFQACALYILCFASGIVPLVFRINVDWFTSLSRKEEGLFIILLFFDYVLTLANFLYLNIKDKGEEDNE